MFILINPRAGNNTVLKKWRGIQSAFSGRASLSLHELDGLGKLRHALATALNAGETDFVAAGGDGTVNVLLNLLLENSSEEQLERVRLGAIGLGSSNDFHKPFSRSGFVQSIPCKTDFSSARPRDIGCVDLCTGSGYVRKHFLNNASIGVTAEANALFNDPGRVLSFFRRTSTQAAIVLAALQAIARIDNPETRLQSADGSVRRVLLTNLAVIKNPHVSGNLHYSLPALLESGSLQFVLCENLNRLQLVSLLRSLGNDRLRQRLRLESWESESLSFKSSHSFAVEFDGEVLRAQQEARFSVLPRKLSVCTC